MNARLIRALARLASLPYQEAFIVNGTTEEYVTPEDVIDEASNVCGMAYKGEQLLNESQKEAINRLIEALNVRGRELWSDPLPIEPSALVHSDENWIALRSSARNALIAFGIDVDALPAERIDSLGELELIELKGRRGAN